jgi:SAM-dependent methyltransferase
MITWLQHPLARGRDIDSPETTYLRRRIVQSKEFLRRIYEDWYAWLISSLPPGPGGTLEIGSGGGFLNEKLPALISSDILVVPGLSITMDACRLPLASNSLKALVMTNVLHHIPCVRAFFREAARCVRPGGAMLMVEPWNTRWGSWVYTHLHHEPFEPEASTWSIRVSGPLSGANGALPWILFHRDRHQFSEEFPTWSVEVVRLEMPFRYLLSGGVATRSILPGFSYPLVRTFERLLTPWMGSLAMFAYVTLRRTHVSAESPDAVEPQS